MRFVWLFLLFGLVASDYLRCFTGFLKNGKSDLTEVDKSRPVGSNEMISCGIIMERTESCDRISIEFVEDVEIRMEDVIDTMEDRCLQNGPNQTVCVCSHFLLTPCNTVEWLLRQLDPSVTPNVECFREKVFAMLHPNEKDEQVELLNIMNKGGESKQAEQAEVSQKESVDITGRRHLYQALSHAEVNERLGTYKSWGPIVMMALTAILILFTFYIIYLSAKFELNWTSD